MKRNQVTLAVLLAALSFFAAPSASAISTSQVQAIKKTVVDTRPAELAARAADMVVQASKLDREEVAVMTVREVAAKRAATIIAVVGSISKVAPDVSVAVASEAAKLVAERSAEIARAAAAANPSQADQIAAAVAKVSPKSATKIARAVATTVPDQTPRIVEEVVRSVPTASTEISKDITLTRITERMASTPGNNGTIISIPGTISGKPAPILPPTDAGTPTAGADPKRKYGSATP